MSAPPILEPELTIVEVDGLLPGASNATLLARDETGSAWVYKPDRGERPLWDFAHGSLWRREIACYRLSETFGLHVVPETLVAAGPYGPGSAQRFLDEDMEWDPRPAIVAAATELWPVVVLDLIANNADRKIGHLLRQPGEEKVWAIDNGLTFHVGDKLRTVLWSFAGRSLPPAMVAELDPDSAVASVAGLLDQDEIEETGARVNRLLADPTHPRPPDDRPAMPWPLW